MGADLFQWQFGTLKNKIKTLTSKINGYFSRDIHWLEVVKGGAVAALLRAVGLCFAFFLNSALARVLGADGVGIYFIALSIVTISSVIARVGLDNAVIKLMARNFVERNDSEVHGLFISSVVITLAASTILSVVWYFFTPWFSIAILGKVDLTDPLTFMLFGIISYSTMRVVAECFRGCKMFAQAAIVGDVLYPLIGLIVVVPCIYLYGVSGASIAFVIATTLTAIYGAIMWCRYLPNIKREITYRSLGELIRNSKPLFLMSVLLRGVQPWAPLLLLGIWGTVAETGIFGVVTRISMLAMFFLVSLNTSLAPKFVELHRERRFDLIEALSRRSALLITALASPLFIILMFHGSKVLGLFGEQFIHGEKALLVLSIGYIFNTLTGSVGFLLMMTGYEIELRNVVFFSTVLLLLACVILIPSYGLIGAAIATALSIVARNIVLVYVVYKKMGIVAVPFLKRGYC